MVSWMVCAQCCTRVVADGKHRVVLSRFSTTRWSVLLTQVPQRIVCTGFSNGGAYAELCGIWAAIQWPAAPVRVIVWGAPVVSASC